MSRTVFFNRFRPLGLLILLTFSLACSRTTWKSAPQDLQLTLTLSKPKYLPGEPVAAMLTLTNASGKAVVANSLDHASVSFSVMPRLKNGPGDMRFIDPVYSEKEPVGKTMRLDPLGSTSSTIYRTFYFTTLSFERGDFLLEAVYSRPPENSSSPAPKTYAKPVLFTVEGQKVFAHRYLGEGLISREDAVGLATAAAKAAGRVSASDTLLITDELGFKNWWVNLKIAGPAGPVVKSYFVNPYIAQVRAEAQPFTAADKGDEAPMAPEKGAIERLKEQSKQKRMK